MLRQGRGWMRCLMLSTVFIEMVMLFHLFDTCLVCVQLLCRMSPLSVNVGSPSIRGTICGVGYSKMLKAIFRLWRLSAFSSIVCKN